MPVEVYYLIGKIERYYIPLQYIFKILFAELLNIIKIDLIL
jgi:hypothetical protein